MTFMKTGTVIFYILFALAGNGLFSCKYTSSDDPVLPTKEDANHWQQIFKALNSKYDKCTTADFVTSIREFIYFYFPLSPQKVLQDPFPYFAEIDNTYHKKTKEAKLNFFFTLIKTDVFAYQCGELSLLQKILLSCWDLKSANISIGAKDVSNEIGHVQTIVVTPIENLAGYADTILAVHDAMFNFSYTWPDGELMDIRDMVYLLASGQSEQVHLTESGIHASYSQGYPEISSRCQYALANPSYSHLTLMGPVYKVPAIRTLTSYLNPEQESVQQIQSILDSWEINVCIEKPEDFKWTALAIRCFYNARDDEYWIKVLQEIDSIKSKFGYPTSAGINY